ncbi:MAG: YraN family protein [Coriobacteriales bacterium]|jgi:putative endonuclease|nr:YraN family protein [Coriobacteriales bacterium]
MAETKKTLRQAGHNDKPTSKNREKGRQGEDIALRYLKEDGAQIVERNYRCSSGEADLIFREDQTLVFAEVKTRSGIEYGLPEDSVTRAKRKRYEQIALNYLAGHACPSCRVRFDVIAITMISPNQVLLRHHRDAFAAGE